MPRARYEPLNVFLNSRLVGQLRRDVSGAISFQYDPSWLEWEFVLPVSLSLPLRQQAYSGAPVIAVFDNLLPDNDHLRRQIAARTRAEGIDAYSLLGAIGHDCVGALQFLPQNTEPGPAGATEGDPISDDQIALIIEGLATAPLGVTEDESFRISIAGAQEKTALLYRDGKWYKPCGTAATTHIFKPSIGKLPNGLDLSHSVENEYFCLKLGNGESWWWSDSTGGGLRTGDSFGYRKKIAARRFPSLQCKNTSRTVAQALCRYSNCFVVAMIHSPISGCF